MEPSDYELLKIETEIDGFEKEHFILFVRLIKEFAKSIRKESS